MAQITLTIPDAHVQRVIAALCTGRVVPGTETPLPLTAGNAKAVVVEMVTQIVRDYEYGNAVKAAREAVTPPDMTGIVT